MHQFENALLSRCPRLIANCEGFTLIYLKLWGGDCKICCKITAMRIGLEIKELPRNRSMSHIRIFTALQGDQLDMAVSLWYLVESDLSNVQYTCTEAYTEQVFKKKVTRKTMPCLTVHPVRYNEIFSRRRIFRVSNGIKTNVYRSYRYIIFPV